MQLIHCAMDLEAKLIIEKYNLKKIDELKNIVFYKNDKLLLIVSGIGKIQTSISLTHAVNNYGKFKKYINIGIAGNTGKQQKSKVGDIFLPNQIYQHDMYLPFEGSHLDYAKKPIVFENDIKFNSSFDFNIFYNSICATGDQFIDDKEKINEIVNKTNADIIEMEAFAFVSVLREYDLLDKVCIIKSISDSADKNAIQEHENNLEKAMINGITVLDHILYN